MICSTSLARAKKKQTKVKSLFLLKCHTPSVWKRTSCRHGYDTDLLRTRRLLKDPVVVEHAPSARLGHENESRALEFAAAI